MMSCANNQKTLKEWGFAVGARYTKFWEKDMKKSYMGNTVVL